MACSSPSTTGITVKRIDSNHGRCDYFRIDFLGILKVCPRTLSMLMADLYQRVQRHRILIRRRPRSIVCNAHRRKLSPWTKTPSPASMAVAHWHGVAG